MAFHFFSRQYSTIMSHYFVRKCVSTNYFSYVLTRVPPVICIQKCHAHDINLRNGPVSILNQKVVTGELMNDEHQMKVAHILQGIYREVHSYKPQQLNLLEKWFGGKKKEAPKGLYIYGAVGGGKTMLMDLFYNCCQVSQVAI